MAESKQYLLPNTQGRYVTVTTTNTSGEVYRINDDRTRTIYADYFEENQNIVLESSTFASEEFRRNLSQNSQEYNKIISSSILQASGQTRTETDPNQPGVAGGSTPTNPNVSTSPKQQPTPQLLKYPQDLHVDQDTIQFTAVQYIPPGLEPQGTVRKTDTKRSLLGTVTLPIQSMISDSNRAEWNSDQLNEFYRRALNASSKTIKSGTTTKDNFDVGPGIRETLKDIQYSEEQVLAALGQYIIGIDSNLVGRTGGVLNQNLELLFTGPTLRPFTFNFKMIARDKPEGEEIKRIINFFKRNMAPKKGNQLFLKAPNTFMIKYTGNGEQGLNKIKECALLACNVTYTPNGTYMTYKDGTMVEYQMTLSFQELEPVYDTDYDDHPIGY